MKLLSISLVLAATLSLVAYPYAANSEPADHVASSKPPVSSTPVDTEPDPVDARNGRHFTLVSRAFTLTGLTAITLGLGYSVFRYSECDGFTCSEDRQRPALDLTADILGYGVGIGSLVIATWLYCTSDEKDRTPSARINVVGDSIELVFSTQF